MIKQVFIPLHVSEQEIGELLELYTRHSWLRSDNIFKGLVGSGLEAGIVKARQLLAQLQLRTGNGIIHCVNSQPPLINPESTALGLILISLMSKTNCQYSKLLVNAYICEDDELTLLPTHYWRQKMAAIALLGEQEHLVPLLLPTASQRTLEPDSDDYLRLAALNIKPFFFDNARQIIDFISA